MKLLISSLFIINFFASTAQFNISLDLRKQVEHFNENEGAYAFVPSFGKRSYNDYYGIRSEYAFSNWIVLGNVSYMPKSVYLSMSETNSSTTSTGSGSYTESTSTEGYSARAKYGYLGLRVGGGYKFFSDKRFNIIAGVSLQADILTNERESEHRGHYSYSTHSYDDNGAFAWGNSSSNTSSQEFDAIKLESVHFLYGPTATFRYNFNKVFIDLYINTMFYTWERHQVADVNPYNNQYHHDELLGSDNIFIALEYGFRFGFSLPNKE